MYRSQRDSNLGPPDPSQRPEPHYTRLLVRDTGHSTTAIVRDPRHYTTASQRPETLHDR
jgi:hypothetical protein